MSSITQTGAQQGQRPVSTDGQEMGPIEKGVRRVCLCIANVFKKLAAFFQRLCSCRRAVAPVQPSQPQSPEPNPPQLAANVVPLAVQELSRDLRAWNNHQEIINRFEGALIESDKKQIFEKYGRTLPNPNGLSHSQLGRDYLKDKPNLLLLELHARYPGPSE